MKIPKRGERGFTLIELLIVVAILGVLAAVVIPNVGRFIGRGEEEAKETELASMQASVQQMMVDNEMALLITPVSLAADRTNNMTAFPDTTLAANKGTDILGKTYLSTDRKGFILFGHDRQANDNSKTDNATNYVASNTTAYWYTVDIQGTVMQYDTATP